MFSLALVAVAFACGGKSIRIGAEEPADGRGGGSARGGSDVVAGRGGTTVGGTGAASGGAIANGGTLATGGTGAASIGGTGAAYPGRGGGSTAGAAPVQPPGPVLCGGAECEPPFACCLATGLCFHPVNAPELCERPEPKPDAPGASCASNAHCNAGETCVFLPGSLCLGTGNCTPIANCPGSGYPVCGCDGNSYPNVETACRAGTNPGYFHGRCGDTIDANDGEGSSPRLVTLCRDDTQCADDERCCALTRSCYPASDPGRCQVPPDGTRNPCTADEQCFPGYEFCSGPSCAGPGGCSHRESHEEECGVRFAPVCGCNGVTYTSDECASAEGVRVASQGECPEP